MYSVTSTAERQIARYVKENLTYIVLAFDTEHTSIAEIDKEETCELSYRNIISVGVDCFQSVNIRFQPSFTGKKPAGPQHFLTECDVDTRKKLYANVVPSGGTAIFQGIVERMTNELTALAPSTM